MKIKYFSWTNKIKVKKSYFYFLGNRTWTKVIYSLLAGLLLFYITEFFFKWRLYPLLRQIHSVLVWLTIGCMTLMIIMGGWRAFKATERYDQGETSEMENIVQHFIVVFFSIVMLSLVVTKC